MIWQRRLDAESATETARASTSTTTTSTTSTMPAATSQLTTVKLQCPPSSCPARYATAPPRRMMWPLREQRHIDSVYSYSPVSKTTSLARSSTTLHVPTSSLSASASAAHIALTSATKTSDVSSHTVIL